MQESRLDENEIYIKSATAEYKITKAEIKALIDKHGKGNARETIEKQIADTFFGYDRDNISIDVASDGTPLLLEVRNYG